MTIFDRFRRRRSLCLSGHDIDIIRLGLLMVKLNGADALDELPEGRHRTAATHVLQDVMRIDAELEKARASG